MGYELADAQNYAVRVFLYQFSKQFKFFTYEYREKTLKYFDYRCPYTGIKITYQNSERDHIIPSNKESCGLHLYGNVLIVSKDANRRKGNKPIEEFLKDEPEKLAKIKAFMKETGFLEIHEKYFQYLHGKAENLYIQTGELIKMPLS